MTHAVKLAAGPAVDYALDESERRHAHEKVEWMKFEPTAAAGLDDVGHDRLERGEESAEQRKE